MSDNKYFKWKKVFGKYNPSTDTPTHQIIYKTYNHINAISHTHSKYATAWAQTGKSIPIYGTTHSDYWASKVPVTGYLKKKQLVEYEKYWPSNCKSFKKIKIKNF